VVIPVTPADTALIVVVPAAAPEASPAELMVAADVFDEVQVAWLVKFCVLPSE
jgi:hypothetical protein